MPKSKRGPATVPPKMKGGGKGLSKLKSFLRSDHFVPKDKGPPSVYIPWKAYLVSSIHVEKQLKEHEDCAFNWLSPLGIAKAVTHPSIFVNEEAMPSLKSLKNLLVLQVVEIVRKKRLPNVDRPLIVIKAKDWPNSNKSIKNSIVYVGDETLGTVIRCLVKQGDLVIIAGATKIPLEKEVNENTEIRGLAIKTKQLEKNPQYIYIFKRGDNVPLTPTTLPDLPRSLKVSEKLTLSKYDQTLYRVTFADSEMMSAPPSPPKRRRVEETLILSKNNEKEIATQKNLQPNETRQISNNYESLDQITDEEEHHSSVEMEIVKETPPEDNPQQPQQNSQQAGTGNERQQTQENQVENVENQVENIENQISDDSQDLRQTQFANLLESQMLGSMPTLDEDSQQSQVSQPNEIPVEKQNPQLHTQSKEIRLPPPSYSQKSSSAASEDSHKAQANNTTYQILSPAPSNNIEKELNTPDDDFEVYLERQLGHLLVEDNNSPVSGFNDEVYLDDKEEEEAEDIISSLPSSHSQTASPVQSNKTWQSRFHSQPVYVDEFRPRGIVQNPLCPFNMPLPNTKKDNDGAVRMRQCFVNMTSIQLKHQLIDMQPKD